MNVNTKVGTVQLEKIERIEYVKTIEYRWTTQSFNERTGNNCKDFRPNYYTNDIQ